MICYFRINSDKILMLKPEKHWVIVFQEPNWFFRFKYRSLDETPLIEGSSPHFYRMLMDSNAGYYYWFVGQIKEDSVPAVRHGMGMKICNNGELEEGYFKDGVQHGNGRCMCFFNPFYWSTNSQFSSLFWKQEHIIFAFKIFMTYLSPFLL